MSQAAPAITRSPAEVVRLTPVSQAGNGICYAVAGETAVTSIDLERMIAAVPAKVSTAPQRKAYYFVPPPVFHCAGNFFPDPPATTLSSQHLSHHHFNSRAS